MSTVPPRRLAGGQRSVFHLKGKQFAGILPVKSCLDISCHYEHNVLDYRMNSNGVHVKMSTDLQPAEVEHVHVWLRPRNRGS